MRIQSQELSMSSQHTEYKSLIESKLSFETYFTKLPDGIDLEDAQEKQINTEKSSMHSYLDNQQQTLSGIIQSLIQMLQQRVASGKEQVVDEDNVNGYVKMSSYEKYEEHESLDFSTSGRIVTDDSTLDINVNFSMTRSFAVENRIDLYTSFDPLVINLEGRVPELQTDTFSFDLDNDGKKEQISRLDAGSGFLALDKNNDGKINEGSELFGTLTGNGFGELSAYDEDNNNWIDENDSIYDSLQVWLRNENSDEKELVGLGEVGIGAIFLSSQESEFTYKTQTNQTLGEMKSSGIFLYEDGQVGNISQIDFAKQNKEQNEPLASLLQA
ncbi:MAG: hypothetical protein Q9M43_04660 [Sulfurimonas sp.]|nr:hypothetical protein [Sulfurimonas sp.]